MPSPATIPIIEISSASRSLFGSDAQLLQHVEALCRSATFLSCRVHHAGLPTLERQSASAYVGASITDDYAALHTDLRSSLLFVWGLSIFSQSEESGHHLIAHNFNIHFKCASSGSTTRAALRRILSLGYDINRLCQIGLPYYRGAGKPHWQGYELVRSLYRLVVEADKPIVFANDLIDAALLYTSCFGGPPPEQAVLRARLDAHSKQGLFSIRSGDDDSTDESNPAASLLRLYNGAIARLPVTVRTPKPNGGGEMLLLPTAIESSVPTIQELIDRTDMSEEKVYRSKSSEANVMLSAGLEAFMIGCIAVSQCQSEESSTASGEELQKAIQERLRRVSCVASSPSEW